MLPREVSPAQFEAGLARLLAASPPEHLGFVGPSSISWRLNAEAVLHVAGPRALLMQFAHPLVAQGITDHTNFRRDPYGRARRTFGSMYTLLYGTREEALRIARRLHAMHARVRGVLPTTVGRYAAGTPYVANDVDLLAWVWSTLADSSVHAFERYVRPLRPDELAAYDAQTRSLALLFGIPPEYWPAGWAGFRAWVDTQVHGDTLALGPAGHELANMFLRGEAGPRAAAPWFRWFAAGTLPPALRDAYDLRPGNLTAFSFRWFERGLRAAVHATPRPLRSAPSAVRAGWRARWRALPLPGSASLR